MLPTTATAVLALVVTAGPFAFARPSQSLPEDVFALPKYRVTFLNALPLLNDSAQKWLTDGLTGGESEFLEQPWQEHSRDAPPLRRPGIEGAESLDSESAARAQTTPDGNYSLELMKMGPRDSYLCFVPQTPNNVPPLPEVEPENDQETTPTHTWSLLQPLSGTCLYHRRGWFTYSYCHNHEVRQFKERAQPLQKHIAGYQPEEDPEWDSYTLGKAPSSPDPGADLTVAEQDALAASLELAKGAGSSYLVQRWGDGTTCDKTGRRREVEVQFHCSMTAADNILLVKELKTCSYLMVINTPRLCGEPGFRSPLDSREETLIRCREIVPSLNSEEQQRRLLLPEADHPIKFTRPKPVIGPPPPPPPPVKEAASDNSINPLLQKVLGSALSGVDGKGLQDVNLAEAKVFIETIDENGQVVYREIDDLDSYDLVSEMPPIDHKALAEALRALGYEEKVAKGDNQDKTSTKKSAGDEKSRKHDKIPDRRREAEDRDEL